MPLKDLCGEMSKVEKMANTWKRSQYRASVREDELDVRDWQSLTSAGLLPLKLRLYTLKAPRWPTFTIRSSRSLCFSKMRFACQGKNDKSCTFETQAPSYVQQSLQVANLLFNESFQPLSTIRGSVPNRSCRIKASLSHRDPFHSLAADS